MNNLNELIFVLNRNKIKTLDKWLPRNSKLRLLFDGINSNTFLNDDMAALAIYHTNAADKKFLMLKKNLKDKLLEILLHCDNSENAGSVTEKFELKKKLAITEMLLMENVYHNAEKILAKTYAEAIRLGFTDIEIESVRQLRILYFLKGVPKETHKYDNELRRLIRRLDYEQIPQAKWEMLMSKKKYILQITDELADEAKSYLAEIESFSFRTNSIIIEIYELKFKLFIAKYGRKYAKVKSILDEIEHLIHQHTHLRVHFTPLEMEMEKARNFRNTGSIEDAIAAIDKANTIADYKAFNKFEVQALQIDILLKAGKYEAAHEIINEVTNTLQFAMLHANDKAFWLLMEGYVMVNYAIMDIQGFVPISTLYTSKNIILALENECKTISKDKIGYQLQFIILKILLLIIKNGFRYDWDASFVNLYIQRHLKNTDEKRTIHFLKLLIKIANIEIDKINPEKVKKLYLKSEKNEEYAYDVCEVLPYQFLIKGLLINANSNKNY